MARLGTIVVGIVNETQVVCVPEARFLGLIALFGSATWGEFRRRAPVFVEEEVDSRYGDPDEVPGDEELLNVYHIPGVEGGDWPWPAADMLHWMPEEAQREFGEEISTTLNGNFLRIEPDRIEGLIANLEARGYAVRREDAAINTISGF